jgi:hypothetical protein
LPDILRYVIAPGKKLAAAAMFGHKMIFPFRKTVPMVGVLVCAAPAICSSELATLQRMEVWVRQQKHFIT